MSVKTYIPYAKQSIDQSDREAVSKALEGDWITRGPQVQAFEEEVAAYCGAARAVAFNSGSSALMAAYYAAETTSYDKAVTSPNTFAATACAADRWGTRTVLIDIDRSSGNLSLEQLSYNLEPFSMRGKPIAIPVHFAGIAVDMKRLDSLIREPRTVVIEDAAHAFGSHYPSGEKVGSCAYSDMTIFSFHPAKTITTGEGGMVLTNNEDLAERLRLFRNNGIRLMHDREPWLYEVTEPTGNYHMTEIQAALGRSQLKRADGFIEKRRALVERYRQKLAGHEAVRLFDQGHDCRTSYHLFVAQIDFEQLKISRKDLMTRLKEEGIGTQVLYIPLYKHPFMQKGKEDLASYFPQMEAYYEQTLALPLFYELEIEDVDRICAALIN